MTTKTGIIYLQKDRFQLYSPYLSNILEFRFVPEISRDFDLYNKPLFDTLLNAYIINNKIPPGSFYIIISENASFIKDFIAQPLPVQNPQQTPVRQPVAPTLDDLQKQASEFLEHIPFDQVAGKTFPLPNGVRAYGTNQEMFEGIKNALEKQGFIIEMVIPSFAFGQEVSAQSTLNINIINAISQKINLVKGYNLLANPKTEGSLVMHDESEEKSTSAGDVIPPEKKDNKNLMVIIAISAIALIFIITGVILYLQFTATPNKPLAAAPTPAPTNAVIIPPTIAAAQVKDLTVQIVNASSSAALAEAVRTALTPYGFKIITLQNQNTLGASQSLLIFSPKVDTQTKNSVTTDVKKILGNVLIQEKSDTTSDITVILGK
jgi:hypothetical protein